MGLHVGRRKHLKIYVDLDYKNSNVIQFFAGKKFPVIYSEEEIITEYFAFHPIYNELGVCGLFAQIYSDFNLENIGKYSTITVEKIKYSPSYDFNLNNVYKLKIVCEFANNTDYVLWKLSE
jgi:hypothetical protein